MKKLMLCMFLFSSLAVWADCELDYEEDLDQEECEPRKLKNYYVPPLFDSDKIDNRLRDDASWPSKNQDPLLEALMN